MGITQEIGGRMATRLAMVAVVLTALMALVGASENHEWFVADLGVSSDLGEDVQADKAPLSAGMIVTLRGGSANHHCGDASGSTACRHKSPTEHQKYRVVDAGGGKIGLRRGTAAFVGKVPNFVQFEVVKTSSGKITIKVPGGGYCAGKRDGPSECSLDVRSSDAIAVVCVHNCGKEKDQGKKEDTPPKAVKQAGASKRPVKPTPFDQERKGKATRRGASSKAKKGTPSVVDPAKEKKIKAKIMKEAAKPKPKKGTLNVADPAKEQKSKIMNEAANKKARVHKKDKLKAAAVARKNKIASFLKNGTKEKKAVHKNSKQKQKTVKKKAQAAKKTVAKKKGEKKKAEGKKKKAKKAVNKKAKGKKKKAKKAVNKKAKGKKKKAKKLKKKKAGGKKKAKKLKKKKAGGKKKGKRRGKRMQ